MSQALYRRYRPETFADVIGQEHVTEPLMQALRTARVNHAYLFSGPRGCGKTTSARILARCLNCEQGPTDIPCGTCDSCVALARGGAGTVDVIEIDAASHGGVDDARELRERASYGPAQSRYKIYIIDEAHMVTPQGFNALLKIVEEPPEHVKFVFATTEPEKVIGTIRSRTHHYPFRLVPSAQLQDYLSAVCASEGVPVEPGVLSFVVRAGGGSVRDSLSVLDQLIAGSGSEGLTYEGAAALLGFTDAELLDATVTAIGHGDAAAAFGQVDRVIETGLDPRRFVEDLLERLRDLIICAAVPDGAAAVLRGVPGDQLERMHVQAAAFGAGGLSRAADIVNAGLTEMTGATAPRLQLELIIARLLLPGASGPAGYAARLDRIERRLDMGVREPAGGPGPPTPAPPGRRGPGAPEEPVGEPMRTATPSRPTATPTPEPAPTPGPAPTPAPRPVEPGLRASTSQPAPASPPEQAAPDRSVPGQSAPGQSAPDRTEQAASPAAPVSPLAGDDRPAPHSVAGGIDHAAIVRAWPDLLDWLSRHKRVTWTLVSANAQPLSFDGSRLILAIETAGLAETFRRGAHPAFVQEALMEVLGVDARVEGVVSGNAPDGDRQSGPPQGAITTPAAVAGPLDRTPPVPPGRPSRPVSAASTAPTTAGPDARPGSAGAADPDATGSGSAARPSPPSPPVPSPHLSPSLSPSPSPSSPSPPSPPSPSSSPPAPSSPPSRPAAAEAHSPDWSSGPPPSVSAPSWATDGEDPIERAPSGPRAAAPSVRRDPPVMSPPAAVRAPEVVDDPESISDDDEDIEASGEVGQAVVERLLGGTVISEDVD